MNYEELVESAGRIPVAGPKSISEYQNNMEVLIAVINKYMTSRNDLTELIGKNNVSMMKNNHFNHVLFISSILQIPNPEVLADTILWVFRTYRSHGFSIAYWEVQINTWLEILKVNLSHEAYTEIAPLYKWIQNNITSFDKLSLVN